MTAGRGAEFAARNYRDGAIAATGVVAIALHVVGENWLLVAFAFVATAAWIVAERRYPAYVAWVSQVAFVVLGILMIWRFAESLLWLSVAGLWLLVGAADLGRLCRRFPTEAAPLDQRLVLSRRLQQLALLGVVSAAVVGAALVLTLELRLIAVSLLAVFVVMVLVRVIRSIGGAELPGNDEEGGD